MRQIAAVLGAVWGLANLYAAYLLLSGGLAAKTAAKGVEQQLLMAAGGLLVGLFALLLLWQCGQLFLTRPTED